MGSNGVIDGIDYLYVATRQWDRSVAFWSALGFTLVSQWGEEGHRAGRLEAGAAAVVLAEAGANDVPTSTLYFTSADVDGMTLGPEVDVVSRPTETHWGTTLMRVRDPDGNVYAVQEGGR